MAVSTTAMAEFWALIDEVGVYAQQDLVAIFATMNEMSREQAWSYLLSAAPESAAMWRSSVVDLAEVFYEETQKIAIDQQVAAFAREINSDAFEESLRWAFFAPQNSSSLSAASGVIDRAVTDGARSYGVSSMAKTRTVFRRAARSDACAFCRLLAQNEYSSAEAAFYVGGTKNKKSTRKNKRSRGEQFHDHCRCQAVKSSEYIQPDYMDQWEEEYRAARKGARGDTSQILANMRKLNESSSR